jgi:hypothetical protein
MCRFGIRQVARLQYVQDAGSQPTGVWRLLHEERMLRTPATRVSRRTLPTFMRITKRKLTSSSGASRAEAAYPYLADAGNVECSDFAPDRNHKLVICQFELSLCETRAVALVVSAGRAVACLRDGVPCDLGVTCTTCAQGRGFIPRSRRCAGQRACT